MDPPLSVASGGPACRKYAAALGAIEKLTATKDTGWTAGRLHDKWVFNFEAGKAITRSWRRQTLAGVKCECLQNSESVKRRGQNGEESAGINIEGPHMQVCEPREMMLEFQFLF